jgi:hypothetical protein
MLEYKAYKEQQVPLGVQEHVDRKEIKDLKELPDQWVPLDFKVQRENKD